MSFKHVHCPLSGAWWFFCMPHPLVLKSFSIKRDAGCVSSCPIRVNMLAHSNQPSVQSWLRTVCRACGQNPPPLNPAMTSLSDIYILTLTETWRTSVTQEGSLGAFPLSGWMAWRASSTCKLHSSSLFDKILACLSSTHPAFIKTLNQIHLVSHSHKFSRSILSGECTCLVQVYVWELLLTLLFGACLASHDCRKLIVVSKAANFPVCWMNMTHGCCEMWCTRWFLVDQEQFGVQCKCGWCKMHSFQCRPCAWSPAPCTHNQTLGSTSPNGSGRTTIGTGIGQANQWCCFAS